MKIGILTYHNTRNCGATLQAYALQQKLLGLGHDCDIIDYRCRHIENTYKIRRLFDNKTPKMFVKWLLTNKNNKNCQKKFDMFHKQHLKTSPVYNRETIADANNSYDAFIVGSDQVWNFKLNGNDFTYLLDFAAKNKAKCSYAASMGGTHIDEAYEDLFLEKLLTFDSLSVREKELYEYLKEKTDKLISLVLDPTLLLDKSAYDFKSNINEKQKYIFVYTIANTPNIENAAKMLSKKTGCKIIWGHMSHRRKKGAVNKCDISPDEFVSYIKNAEYVLTSSFHGMALSIVMEKQFFYDLDKSKENNNSRLETLAKLLNLTARELKSAEFNVEDFDKIDYAAVNKALEEAKAKSIEFLKSIT